MSDNTDQSEYQQSIDNPEAYWQQRAKTLNWIQPWQHVYQGDFTAGDGRWFVGGKLNACVNCVDRHLPERQEQVAIHWQGDDVEQQKTLSYGELFEQVCQFANSLTSLGVKKGDRVCLYLPMIPELAIAMLACARIGAVHTVVFAGFSADSLAHRIDDCQAKIVITADQTVRGGKPIALKQTVDKALTQTAIVEHCIVVKTTDDSTLQNPRDQWWHTLTQGASIDCPAEIMDADDPLFILYTSGSTGKPKGILHTTGGYLVYAATTFREVFDYQDGDVYWCTADFGWITGHSYGVYGPMMNGATSVMFAGVPNYPQPDRCWQIIDQYQVTIFYTAPTVIRALAKEGDEWVTPYDLSSLRILGSVGEPINPAAWQWYYDVVGRQRCAVVDTWWQTETGGIMITPLPHSSKVKPGCATQAFFGIQPVLVDNEGKQITGNDVSGQLCINAPWPGMLRGIYGDEKRFKETYFNVFPGYYFSGDNCHRDADGDYWIIGRCDDVLNVSGHRLGTAEIESALVAHPAVAEAAVVGIPHEITGEGVCAYLILNHDQTPSDELTQAIRQCLREKIGAIAHLEHLYFVDGLPKTRSGKIMRRILRKLAQGDEALGDVSTLADPSVVSALKKSRDAVVVT